MCSKAACSHQEGEIGSAVRLPISVVLRTSDCILEHAIRAYLHSCSRVNLVPQQGLPDADVSVLLLDVMNDEWLRVLKRDAACTVDVPVPIVMVADEISERQLTLAIEYGLISFFYRGTLSLDQLGDALIEASVGNGHMPDDLVGHLIAELGRQQRQRAMLSLSQKTGLSVREIQVLRMLSEGMSTVEIAESMSYSERTIKGIVHDVAKRLKARNRTQAVAYAIRAGIL